MPRTATVRAFPHARAARRHRPAASIYQMRQRELAWVLYITEGYIANVEKAIAVNCVTFEAPDLEVVNKAREAAEQAAADLRDALQNIMRDV